MGIKKKKIKRNLVSIQVGVTPAEYKKIEKARKNDTNPSLSNFCRTKLVNSFQ